MVMIKVNINQMKTHLSHYLELLERGEEIYICKRNIPVAELVALENKSGEERKERKIGLAKGEFIVPDDIVEPLDQETTDLFYENTP
jgi:antitoxin (DNA-binding transcriptional repressor) of toxin-antitoxin stability system